jgi:hypothetical protein
LHLHCTPFLAFFCSNVLHCLFSIVCAPSSIASFLGGL